MLDVWRMYHKNETYDLEDKQGVFEKWSLVTLVEII